MSSLPSRAFFLCLLALACLSTARASDRPAPTTANTPTVDAKTSIAAPLTEAETLLAAWPERTTAL